MILDGYLGCQIVTASAENMTEILARTPEKSAMKFTQAQQLRWYFMGMDTYTKTMNVRRLLGNFFSDTGQ